MNTSLSLRRAEPYDVECVGSSVSQYYYLQQKLTNKYTKNLTRVGTIVDR